MHDDGGTAASPAGVELLEIGSARLVVVVDRATGAYTRMGREEAGALTPSAAGGSAATVAPRPPADGVNRAVQRLARAAARHRRAVAPLLSALMWLAVAAGTLAAATVSWRDAWDAARTLGGLGTLTAVLATLAVAAVHELAHALALAVLGGSVGRVGMAFVHLMPALYCDTTDLWRLPRRRSRVTVLLAGVLTNLLAGSAALLAVVTFPGLAPVTVGWLAAFGLMNVALAGFNLLPVMKVDGYYVLEAALAWPGLREDCLDYTRRVLACWVRGRRADVPAPGRSAFCLLFGLLSAVVPALLVAGAVLFVAGSVPFLSGLF